MRLTKLEIHNYMSVDHLELDFEENNLMVLVGDNGSGKSSILESIPFALTGHIQRGVKIGEVVRRGSKGGCFVRCKFTLMSGDELEVVRYREHPVKKNSLDVFFNSEEVGKGSRPSDKQEALMDILERDDEELLLGLLFGQGSSGLSYFTSSAMKKLVESIVRVGIYKQAEKLAKENKKTSKHKLEVESARLESYGSIPRYERRIDTLRSFYGVCNNYNKVLRVINNMSSLQNKLLQDAINKERSSLTSLQTENNFNRRKLEDIATRLSKGICTHCNRSLNEDHMKDLKRSQQNLLDLIRDKEEEIREVNHQMNYLQAEFRKYSNVLTPYTSLTRVTGDITEEGKRIKQVLGRLERGRQNVEDRMEKLSRGIKLSEFWEKGFGINGIRSLLLSTVVPRIEKKAAQYLEFISNGLLTVTITEENNYDKLLVNVNNEGKDVVVKSLSGGERRKVDVALGMAMCDIIGLGTLLWDEWFDGLDEESIVKVHQILLEKSEDKTVLVSTHQQGFTGTHLVTKEGGITKLHTL